MILISQRIMGTNIKIGFSLFLFFFYALSFSQPQKVNYQAVALTAGGQTVKNQAIKLRLSIVDSNATGTVLYTETHQPTTDGAGQFSVFLGGGTATLGTFSNVAWSNGKEKFLKAEADVTGGTNYVLMGTSQIMSVPYALFAEKSGSTFQGGGPVFVSPLDVYNISSQWTLTNSNVSVNFDTLIGQHVSAVILYYEHRGYMGQSQNPIQCTVDVITNGITYEFCDHFNQMYQSTSYTVYGGSSGQITLPLSPNGLVTFVNSLIRTNLKVKLIGYYH
jgi:hypothetical protein